MLTLEKFHAIHRLPKIFIFRRRKKGLNFHLVFQINIQMKTKKLRNEFRRVEAVVSEAGAGLRPQTGGGVLQFTPQGQSITA